MRRFAPVIALFAALAFLVTPVALAVPVAKNDAEYTVLGRVFPDPLAGCQAAGTLPCSPSAQGTFPATQFIQWEEFVDALRYMNTRPDWQRHMEVLVLDGKIGAGSGTEAGDPMFPGNNLPSLEWDPKAEYVSAGLPTTTLERKKSDLVVVRVTDESVPDKGKKRYTLALSIHGIERAGLEGGTRAMEDVVTAYTTGKWDDPIVSEAVTTELGRSPAPTFADVLRKTIIYFTYPNPDGWRRGSVTEGGVFYQRYNGNGVDLNRDWPDVGYTFRPYSGASEPETRAFLRFYGDIQKKTKAGFAAGDDLHGMPGADALSYTMLPHGRHDYGKDARLREVAKTINAATYEAVKWSPIIQPNDAPPGFCGGTSVATFCGPIYGQTWGTVYDTINYTTTGTLGDWFDSRKGLNSDGIDNEMAFSHLDRNIVFDPHGEQMHVDGNKALIYGHLADIVNPPARPTFDVAGTKAYVPNERLVREEQVLQEGAPKKSVPQTDYTGLTGTPDAAEDGSTVIPFTVYRTKAKGKTPGIYNGGMRVDVTTTNVAGIASGLATLKVQCMGCDQDHAGAPEPEWVTVAEDYNQSFVYAQAGLTAAVNHPLGSEKGTQWRAVVSEPAAITKMDVHFTSDPITTDGNTEGGDPPVLHAYDVANTDFFADLNAFIPTAEAKFRAIDPAKVIAGEQSLAEIRSLVLADDPLPGYTGTFAGEPAGGTSQGRAFADTKVTTPSQGPTSCIRSTLSADQHLFDVGVNERNGSVAVRIEWADPANDWDLYLQYLGEDGVYRDVKSSTNFNFETGDASEELSVPTPAAGAYRIQVVNCTAVDPNYTGQLSFTAASDPPAGRFTQAQKDAWIGALTSWVAGGGNLVLTDGALRALPELTSVPETVTLSNVRLRTEPTVKQQVVYAGQMAFAKSPTESTLDHHLADDIDQRGARFNIGMRRQTFEPTPLGFSIQNEAGSDAAGSPQFDVSRAAWENAGGQTAATSADGGARNAQAVHTRVALGELKVGAGTVRIAGALLPQPSPENDHPLGIEPYAVTYTGYILAGNLLDVTP